jgi:DNA-binding transcriptional LysR family regulator
VLFLRDQHFTRAEHVAFARRFGPLEMMTFSGFYLYYPSRRQQPSKLKAFVDYALAHAGKR